MSNCQGRRGRLKVLVELLDVRLELHLLRLQLLQVSSESRDVGLTRRNGINLAASAKWTNYVSVSSWREIPSAIRSTLDQQTDLI